MLISAAGGPSRVVSLAIRHNIRICERQLNILQCHGLAKHPYPKTLQVIALLESLYGESIKVPPTHEELLQLIQYFGGAAGTANHFEQHHPEITLDVKRVNYMYRATKPTYPLYPLAVQVCLALRADKPRFKPFEGRYHGVHHSRGRLQSLAS